MKPIRVSSEDEAIYEYLSAEYESARFGDELREHIANSPVQFNISLLTGAFDPTDRTGCEIRRRLLGEYRGWGQNRDMYEGFPDVLEWHCCELEPSDLAKIFYVNYSYWNELSKKTGEYGNILDAADNILAGLCVYDQPNAPFLSGAELLLSGGSFKPVILAANNMNNPSFYIILEGHSRLTALALASRLRGDYVPKQTAYVALCPADRLHIWDGRGISEVR